MAGWPTIPAVGSSTESLLGAVRALKAVVEMMLRQRGGAPAPIPVVYRDWFKPGSTQSSVQASQLNDMDLFIDRSNNDKLNYWDASVGVWRLTS